ncbi:MAG: hypothetical protein DMG74_12090 [Acidobacteria bacterium]|nr:MAG: hypothetical protein DMG74_12090 [Acidobacteriota bacterium]
MATLYTIGHSTRALDELVSALKAHSIDVLVDIRSLPMSHRLPHFNRESLVTSLPAAGIKYVWMKELGGRRKKIRDDSPNTGMRSASFRNYADHMLTPEFKHGISQLLGLAGNARIAYMCAERVYFRCHRMLVSDWLVAHGHTVLHIDSEKTAKPHRLTPEARVVDDQVIYNADQLF